MCILVFRLGSRGGTLTYFFLNVKFFATFCYKDLIFLQYYPKMCILAFCPFPKISLGKPYLKISTLQKKFSGCPYEQKNKKNQFYPLSEHFNMSLKTVHGLEC